MKIPMEKFSLVECSELYQQNSSSPCLLVNTDEIFLSVYTEGITMGKEGIKKAIRYNDVLFLQKNNNGINMSVIFVHESIGNI